MTATEHQALREQLMRHEGLQLQAYQDSLGYWTIGVGRLIDARKGGGITLDEATLLLDHDIETCLIDLQAFPWFATVDAVRARAVCDLRFNLGQQGLLGFSKFLAAMSRADYDTAANELIHSKWYGQVGTRGPTLVTMIRTGRDPTSPVPKADVSGGPIERED